MHGAETGATVGMLAGLFGAKCSAIAGAVIAGLIGDATGSLTGPSSAKLLTRRSSAVSAATPATTPLAAASNSPEWLPRPSAIPLFFLIYFIRICLASARSVGTPAFANVPGILLKFFVPVCDPSNKGTRFEKRKRVCRRVEIQRGTGGFNAENQNSVPPRRIVLTDARAETHHVVCGRDAFALNSVVCEPRPATGVALPHACALAKESIAHCERSSRFAWPRPPLQVAREMACRRTRDSSAQNQCPTSRRLSRYGPCWRLALNDDRCAAAH
jgi:hypothetical protein